MELTNHLTIVSAYGRGHWLAASLVREGLEVTLIDVTSKLGLWPSEDAEGPFGFFRHDKLNELQIERIFSEDPFVEVSNGFTIWLQKGPIEFKSQLTPFYFEKNNWSQEIYNLLSASQNNSDSKYSPFYKKIIPQKFSQQWIVHLAHQLASTTYMPSARSANLNKPASLLSNFFIRQATRLGLDKSLKWLKTKGVEVLSQTEIKDLSFGAGKTISGFELLGEKKGHFKADQVVWMLSSEESYFLNEKVAKYLFPEGHLEPEWCWVRYRIKLDSCPERNCLPLHCVMLNDLNSPWTHENLMILQRTALEDQFDIWVRLPNVQRFNKEYLTNRGSAIVDLLLKRMDQSNPVIQAYPQEYSYTYSQLGASRFPLFQLEMSGRRGVVLYNNLYLDGPELWSQFLWDAAFENQQKIHDGIKNWWKMRLQKIQLQQKQQQKQQGRDL